MERMTKLEDLDRSFDIAFWQAQDSTARFAAAWELVVDYYRFKGKDASELRLQRSVEAFQRLSRPIPRHRRLRRHSIYRTSLHKRP
jgi:hypothetical protein